MVVAVARGEEAQIDFNRQIRPILSDRCFACHGPDQQGNKSGLRLDTPEGAFEALKSGKGFAFVAGDPAKSVALQRMTSDDSSIKMPPPEFKVTVSKQEIDLIERWIEQGAEYQPHWAFVPPPDTVVIPKVHNDKWVRDPIDAFVMHRLEEEGLSPTKEAGRTRWLRRVTYDLTGLPPTPDDVEAFLADQSPNAFERVVDRLLASPHFGERMAVPWIDVARYADSYGYQSDSMSPTWPWRDWVIRAFNNNLPYDQFIVQQIAGDMLPDATREQKLATAFNRLHRMTGEGGSIAEEWRIEGVADRVHTFGTAFLGLTLDCARCHDHKYDPISQKNYYEFASYFNNIDEWGLYDASHVVPTPTLLLPNESQEKRLAELQLQVHDAESKLKEVIASREEAFKTWLAAGSHEAVLPDLLARYNMDQLNDKAQVDNTIEGGIGALVTGGGATLTPGKQGNAIAFDGDSFARIQLGFRLSRWQPFTVSFNVRDDQPTELHRVIMHETSGTDPGPRGVDLLITDGKLTARLFRHWPGNAIAIETNERVIPKGKWVHIVWTYDGFSVADGIHLYIDGRLADTHIVRDHLLKNLDNGDTRDHGPNMLAIATRFRDRGFKGGVMDDLAFVKRAVSPIEARQLFDGRALADALVSPGGNQDALKQYYIDAIDPDVRQARDAALKAWEALVNHENSIYEISVMEDMSEPRPTYVLARGEYDAKVTEDDRVNRGVPSVFPPLPRDAPDNRLGLGQWLTAPNHPLTSRVAVNRFWQTLFGKGLVATSDNFGQQGALPTHADLLDYLARDFMDSGWDVKRLCRKVVLSATYRQDSGGSADLFKRDPNNDLLARGPAYRLPAEMIRDTALFASGLLVERLGGPPAYPYQPPDVWTEANTMSRRYPQGHGEELYRRSVYTVLKRTSPTPNMIAFDAATREICVARRESTNTPMQALVLLNDVQFVEASRVLGQKMLADGGDDDESRITFAFKRLTARQPGKQEMALLLELYGEQRAYFAEEPERITKFVAIGESKVPEDLDKQELAAATVIAQTILNLDATVWKR